MFNVWPSFCVTWLWSWQKHQLRRVNRQFHNGANLFFISSPQTIDQPQDLNQIWPVGRKWRRFTNAPKNVWGPPQIWGAKTSHFDHFFVTSALDTAYLWNKTSHLRPRNGWDHWLIVTHPMKIQHFPSLSGFPHKGHWTQANQILPDVRGLKWLTIHRKNVRKSRPPKNSHPA